MRKKVTQISNTCEKKKLDTHKRTLRKHLEYLACNKKDAVVFSQVPAQRGQKEPRTEHRTARDHHKASHPSSAINLKHNFYIIQLSREKQQQAFERIGESLSFSKSLPALATQLGHIISAKD